MGYAAMPRRRRGSSCAGANRECARARALSQSSAITPATAFPPPMAISACRRPNASATSPGTRARWRSRCGSASCSMRRWCTPRRRGWSSTATASPMSDTLIAGAVRIHRDPRQHGPSAPTDKAERIARYYVPFHDAIDRLLAARKAAGLETILVCMHSFTPIFKGVARPWPIGILPAAGRDLQPRAVRCAAAPKLPDIEHRLERALCGGARRLLHGRSSRRRPRRDDDRNPARRNSRTKRRRPLGGPAGPVSRARREGRTARAPAHLSPPQRGATGLEGRD